MAPVGKARVYKEAIAAKAHSPSGYSEVLLPLVTDEEWDGPGVAHFLIKDAPGDVRALISRCLAYLPQPSTPNMYADVAEDVIKIITLRLCCI